MLHFHVMGLLSPAIANALTTEGLSTTRHALLIKCYYRNGTLQKCVDSDRLSKSMLQVNIVVESHTAKMTKLKLSNLLFCAARATICVCLL